MDDFQAEASYTMIAVWLCDEAYDENGIQPVGSRWALLKKEDWSMILIISQESKLNVSMLIQQETAT